MRKILLSLPMLVALSACGGRLEGAGPAPGGGEPTGPHASPDAGPDAATAASPSARGAPGAAPACPTARPVPTTACAHPFLACEYGANDDPFCNEVANCSACIDDCGGLPPVWTYQPGFGRPDLCGTADAAQAPSDPACPPRRPRVGSPCATPDATCRYGSAAPLAGITLHCGVGRIINDVEGVWNASVF